MSNEPSNPIAWAQRTDNVDPIRRLPDECGFVAGGSTLERVVALVNAARESAEKLQAVESATATTVAALNDAWLREAQQQSRAESAEKREAEALATLNAAEDALTDAAVTDAETLPERIRELAARAENFRAERDENDAAWQGARDRASRLQAERDTAIRERAEMVRERDNCREVLRKEREDRASQTATMGQALASLRAERNELGETVEKLTAENARLTSQLEVVERILTSALRAR